MVKIYCIEDINDLKYVGSTSQKLYKRFSKHRCDHYIKQNCSSCLLNLEYAIIYELEDCEEDVRKEREKYWINNLDTVNERKLTGRNDKENFLRWYNKHKRK